MMRTPRAVRAAAAAATLWLPALAGCGGGGPARHTVEIRDFLFSPAATEVREGDEVTFVNRDPVPHTATAANGAWDTGEIPANGSKTVTVKGPGAYRCVFHPTMAGTLAAAK